MADPFETAFAITVEIEGGFSNDAADSGGKTKYGITEAVARANGYPGRIEDLTKPQAKAIYKSQYWDTLRLDALSADSPRIAQELFDTAVNCGVVTAGKFLQRALNTLNQEAKDFPDTVVDGLVGPMTLTALATFLEKRGQHGETVLLRALNAQQCVRYMEITETKPTQERFLYGWILNRVEAA